MNRGRMERGILEFLEGLFEGEGARAELEEVLAQTPRRVTSAFADEMLAGYRHDPTQILQPMTVTGATGPVVLRDLRFTSVCAHHLLPYIGRVHAGFVPDRSHAGLGGIARLVDVCARRLTFQESLTAEIADALNAQLEPKSLLVVVEAEHACLAARGARKQGHRLRTLERRGAADADLERLLSEN